MNKFDQVVFIVEDGAVLETSIRDYSGRFIDETTTPHGAAPRLHTRGNELWTWGHQGSFPKLVQKFDTEDEAEEALEDSFAYDFWNASDILAFNNRADAEQYLTEVAEETAAET